jgi:hypothetical protein
MLKYHKTGNIIISELEDKNFVITEAQDILDLMGDAVSENCNRMIIREENLNPDFFKLQTGLAGEILQKFSNYNFKLAIIGDFNKYKSKNLQDFIRESNKGNMVFFVSSFEEALIKLQTRIQI